MTDARFVAVGKSEGDARLEDDGKFTDGEGSGLTLSLDVIEADGDADADMLTSIGVSDTHVDTDGNALIDANAGVTLPGGDSVGDGDLSTETDITPLPLPRGDAEALGDRKSERVPLADGLFDGEPVVDIDCEVLAELVTDTDSDTLSVTEE